MRSPLVEWYLDRIFYCYHFTIDDQHKQRIIERAFRKVRTCNRSRIHRVIADNETLAVVMATLAAAIRAMPVAAVTPKVYDPFKSKDPFDVSS